MIFTCISENYIILIIYLIISHFNFVAAKERHRGLHHESVDIRFDVLLLQSTTRNFYILAQFVVVRTTSLSVVSAFEIRPRCSQPLQRSRNHDQSLHHDQPSGSLPYVSMDPLFPLVLYK